MQLALAHSESMEEPKEKTDGSRMPRIKSGSNLSALVVEQPKN